jgi:lipoate-protein ligase A
LDLVGRYLRLPSRQPDYRQGRDHTAFLINLPLDAIQLRCRLRDAWQAEVELTAVPRELIDRLVAEKHSRPEWTRRK